MFLLFATHMTVEQVKLQFIRGRECLGDACWSYKEIWFGCVFASLKELKKKANFNSKNLIFFDFLNVLNLNLRIKKRTLHDLTKQKSLGRNVFLVLVKSCIKTKIGIFEVKMLNSAISLIIITHCYILESYFVAVLFKKDFMVPFMTREKLFLVNQFCEKPCFYR